MVSDYTNETTYRFQERQVPRIGKKRLFMSMQRQDFLDNVPDSIAELLAPYLLFYDVPFCYLLPDEALLPPDSLRFFYIDPNWMFSLLDGLLSPGRAANIDAFHDQAAAKHAFCYAMRKAEDVRRKLQERELLKPMHQWNHTGEFTPETCTGFLIRSPLVTGWRGLEFNAFDAQEQPLRALRIETLARDVMFALFLGEISRFTLSEPPEGLHYGFEYGMRAPLRDFGEGKQTGQFFNLVERGDRTIDFAATAKNIAAAANINDTDMDSTKIALQMTRTACTFYVSVSPKNKEGGV